ncbi:uncharacterized protein LOC133818249 [Humulus lupulus]|uniref:uncharacterized protein LOC133818249 n=1 Tax=Humulus lupulus TaxID=3486 RepID=UPI002B410227|nr:uncharacterized protein LOC133818249 [Humulus lupulus]
MILLLSTPVTKLSRMDLWSSLSNPVAVFSSLETFSWVVICGAAEIKCSFRYLMCKPVHMDIGCITCVIVKETSLEGFRGSTLYSVLQPMLQQLGKQNSHLVRLVQEH